MGGRVCSVGLILLAALLGGCGQVVDPNEPSGFIQIKGSDTMVNAVQKISEEFMKDYPYVFVAVTGGGSGVGIASLINRSCEVAAASREMSPKEIELARKRGVEPVEHLVAFDGVAVIVNKANPVDRLTIRQLHDIFTGKVSNWGDLGGKDLPIVTLSREVSSGTHMYFKERVIHLSAKDSTEEFSSSTLMLSSSQGIVEEVAGNEAAIGYLGMGYTSDRTKSVWVADEDQYFPPTAEYVMSKKYPLARGLYFYTNGQPQGVGRLLLDFTLSPKGQRQFIETGFVPVGVTIAQGDN
ncbi:MAG: phosphate ABC transporter substrate-binding protein [Sedimentisphaerales bacterium]|jgi:phosphate transport system substrate-binding protein|nr:phosphate ABC transporter substrate-binding protein [Sedimentisphaerales bacterium]